MLLSPSTTDLFVSLEAAFIPPKQEQAFNQGGTFVFDGADTLFAHYDESTGAHASVEEVVKLATKAAAGSTVGAA